MFCGDSDQVKIHSVLHPAKYLWTAEKSFFINFSLQTPFFLVKKKEEEYFGQLRSPFLLTFLFSCPIRKIK